MIENWKDVIGFEGIYEVSDYGNVRRVGKTAYLKPGTNQGYPYVQLSVKCVRQNKSIHRLVAEAFIPTNDFTLDVNHKDGIKSNNHVSNLDWMTRSENLQHAYDTGLRNKMNYINTVMKLSLDGEPIDIYKNATEAAIDTINDSDGCSAISKCCKGLALSAYGYDWVYLDSYDPLDKMFEMQKQLQVYLNNDIELLKEKELINYIKENALHALIEIGEMLNELPHLKEWKDYSKMTDEEIETAMNKAREEFIDLFHFMLNIGLALGYNGPALYEAYMKKNEINYKRQIEGLNKGTRYTR